MENLKELVLHNHLFRHFRMNKVEIASAIPKPFPFLMSLRDQDFISEQMFDNFQEACENLVPVNMLVYSILSELEKTFSLSLLKTLFSNTNLTAYPGLVEIFRSFIKVSQKFSPQMDEARESEDMPRLLPYDREETCDPQTPQVTSGGGGEEPQEVLPRQAEGSNACLEMRGEEEPQEASCSSPGHAPVSCDLDTTQMTPEDKPEEVVSQPLSDGEEDISFSLQMSDEEELQEGLCSPPEHEPVSGELEDHPMNEEGESEALTSNLLCSDGEGAQQPAQKNEKCPCVMCSSRDMLEGPGAGDSSQAPEAMDTVNTENGATLGKRKRKTRKKKGHNWSRIKRKRPQNIHQKDNSTANDHKTSSKEEVKMNLQGSAMIRVRTKLAARALHFAGGKRGRSRSHLTQKANVARKRVWSRGSRKYRDETVDFHAPSLRVSCGELKGILYKEKLKKGISVKCIQSEAGDWFTPREFEIKGGYERSKNWKLSVYCGGRPLRWLLQEGFLPHPPRIYRRRKKRTPETQNNVDPDMGNSDVCEVCRRRGLLFCCDTCSRAFHRDCHITPVKIEETPWSCIFCRMDSLDSQESHQESEILKRKMQPKEQLMKETSPNLKEPMWLDKIKKRLNAQGYYQVEEFVKDMRLIFQNHRASYKYHEFGQMGIRLETEFEKNFKKVFAIQETNENS